MQLLISPWQPWRLMPRSQRATLDERVEMAQAMNARLCIKGSDGVGLYGPETWNRFRTPPYKGRSNDDLERLAKAEGVGVDLWSFVYLRNPAAEADVIRAAVARWNPQHVFIDFEVKQHAHNVGAFLRSLGRLPCLTWLQSFRFPDVHQEVNWRAWLSYTSGGQYIIDGLAPQAYFQGHQDAVRDYTRMIEQNDRWARAAGRKDENGQPNVLYFPTLPTYAEHGWQPEAQALDAGLRYLAEELGDRLAGVNAWRQGFLFDPAFSAVRSWLMTLKSQDEPPPDPPEDPPAGPRSMARIDEDLAAVESEALRRGWDL